MKVINSKHLSAYGGINFVFEHLDSLNLKNILAQNLPALPPQSQYQWSDIFYSFLSIYYCGGDCIEDIGHHLKKHFTDNPFFKMTSPDTLLKRLYQLSEEVHTCTTPRGRVEHQFCTNKVLEKLNISILKQLGLFEHQELVMDYDNTIIFSEKADSKMTYKRGYGYQPGVCTLNEEHILYIENRNGNSDAKSFQGDTFQRVFDMLGENGVDKIHRFRADSASYQFEVVETLREKVGLFYIGCRNSYVEKYFQKMDVWHKAKDKFGEYQVGSVRYIPFKRQAKAAKKEARPYRLVVKRRKKKGNQLDLITGDLYEYRAIITNDFVSPDLEVARFYARRGNMERQFDIMKNDFGWNNMPASTMTRNLVFLYFGSICRNLYNFIIERFSKKVKGLKIGHRMKKFIFRFIILPSKWVFSGRQLKLRVYSDLDCSGFSP